MRKMSFAVCLAVLTLSTLALADEWNKSYDLTGKPDLRVAAGDANVHIDTWDQNKIDVHVSTHGWHIGGGGLEVLEHQEGNAVTIELRYPHHNHVSFSIDTRRTELEIRMPRSANANVRTEDGSIVAGKLEGDLEFSTSDGRLTLEDLDGSLRAHTSDGTVRVSGRFDAVDLRTDDGRVEFEARQGSQLKQPWEVRSSDGSVQVRVPGDLAADIDLHTGDGHIVTNIPIVVDGKYDSQALHGKINGGGNRLTIRTSDGSITLDKV
jgi:DUF4097 and DUF4098 domain-containing protein YvlB